VLEMKLRILVLCLAGLSAAACNKDSTQIKAAEAAKAAVTAVLKDPDSAQFRNIVILESGTVCGEVNAKNSFGGYTGFDKFYYLEGEDLLDPDKNDRVFIVGSLDLNDYVNNYVYSKVCKDG